MSLRRILSHNVQEIRICLKSKLQHHRANSQQSPDPWKNEGDDVREEIEHRKITAPDSVDTVPESWKIFNNSSFENGNSTFTLNLEDLLALENKPPGEGQQCKMDRQLSATNLHHAESRQNRRTPQEQPRTTQPRSRRRSLDRQFSNLVSQSQKQLRECTSIQTHREHYQLREDAILQIDRVASVLKAQYLAIQDLQQITKVADSTLSGPSWMSFSINAMAAINNVNGLMEALEDAMQDMREDTIRRSHWEQKCMTPHFTWKLRNLESRLGRATEVLKGVGGRFSDGGLLSVEDEEFSMTTGYCMPLVL